MKNIISITALIGIFFISCTSDSESDLTEPDSDPDAPVSYEANIKQIIAGNCLGCHSDPPVNGAPFALNTYERVKQATDNGNLLVSIKRQTGESAAMPPAGRMPQATIDLIEQWADEGFLQQ